MADQRQSIYRFRGAEPSNVSRFEEEFGGARHSLGHNYRSFAAIVRSFEKFSATMGGSSAMIGAWSAHRADGGEVCLTVTPSLSAEAEAIRDKIEELRGEGSAVPRPDHFGADASYAGPPHGHPRELGVPLLYLGDLFERPKFAICYRLSRLMPSSAGLAWYG